MADQRTGDKQGGFEESLAALDEVINRLEKGDCTLDEMLKLHEQGKKLADRCDKLLNQYEAKITTLAKEDTDALSKEDS